MFTTELTPIENNNQRVLTTEQLAEAYQTGVKVISMNFNRNKNHYTAGVHYYCLTGNELKDFFAFNNLKNTNIGKIRTLYLWTERGALLHAKSLNTEKAWEVYNLLVDNYFRQSPDVTADYNMMFSYILKLYETVLLNNKLLVEKITKMEYMEVIGKQEQEELQAIVKNKVTSLLGAKSVPYRLFAPAMYKLLWRQYRGKFHLDSYKNTPKFRYDEGVQYLKEWKPLKK